MILDMHFHSNKSDWFSTEEELLEEASVMWMNFLALTDHDNVSDEFAVKARKEFNLLSCPAVEISARNLFYNKSLHLTLYAKQIGWKVKSILQNTKTQKILMIKGQIELLNSKWFEIDYKEFCRVTCSWNRKIENLNKMDIVKFICLNERNKQHAISINWWDLTIVDFYKKYLKRSWDSYWEYWYEVDEYEPSIEVCNSMKKTNNWILSIAHSNSTFKDIAEFEKVLPHYLEVWWINALEINSNATKDWVIAILEAQNMYWLYLTFWSDNHMVWTQDFLHWDLGTKNRFITEEQVRKNFNSYSDKLI